MSYRYISDCHTHTACSPDGADSAMMMCESAARLGLYCITVTDHCECNVYRSEGYDRSIRQSYSETRRAGAVFRDRLRVFAGVEIGQPMQDPAAAEDALSSCSFDFALASVHNVRGKDDFCFLDYQFENVDELLQRYFSEIMETIELGRFDSLAHLTYPWRYIEGEHGIAIDRKKWSGPIDEVLKLLIQKKKALEINTSGYRQRIGVSLPDFPVILRYRELGGKLVTLGSDAHRWADVSAGIERGMEMLRKAGFQHFVVYENHEPSFLPLG